MQRAGCCRDQYCQSAEPCAPLRAGSAQAPHQFPNWGGRTLPQPPGPNSCGQREWLEYAGIHTDTDLPTGPVLPNKSKKAQPQTNSNKSYSLLLTLSSFHFGAENERCLFCSFKFSLAHFALPCTEEAEQWFGHLQEVAAVTDLQVWKVLVVLAIQRPPCRDSKISCGRCADQVHGFGTASLRGPVLTSDSNCWRPSD